MASFLYVVVPISSFFVYLLGSGLSFRAGGFGGVHTEVTPLIIASIALAGALGSIVSILVRVKDFAEIRILNPPALFWTGFFKPVIGAIFALFVFCAFASGLVNVNDGIDQVFMWLTLGFVAGFSERFAPDLVSRIELSVTPQESDGVQGRASTV
jgi:hypothetical protein